MNNFGRVTAIIVNWNQKDLLLQAVRSLVESNYPNLSILVVDNGSNDGSSEQLITVFPSVQVVELPLNVGFAYGNNIGIQQALKQGSDYIFLLNNDATVTPDTIQTLVAFLEKHTKACAVTPYIMYQRQPEVIWYGGGRVWLWCGLVAHKHIRQNLLQLKPVAERTDYLTGCAFLVRADAIKAAGVFSPQYVIYSEDVDLSLKLRLNGGELWVEPKALVYHQISASSGGELTPLKGFHRGRSLVLLLKNWGKWWYVPTLLVGTALFGGALTLKMALTGKTRTAVAVWHGVIAGLTGLSIPKGYDLPFDRNMKEITLA